MISIELQNEVETLAQSLGQTPDALLNEVLAEKKKAWALSKLNEAVPEPKQVASLLILKGR